MVLNSGNNSDLGDIVCSFSYSTYVLAVGIQLRGILFDYNPFSHHSDTKH